MSKCYYKGCDVGCEFGKLMCDYHNEQVDIKKKIKNKICITSMCDGKSKKDNYCLRCYIYINGTISRFKTKEHSVKEYIIKNYGSQFDISFD